MGLHSSNSQAFLNSIKIPFYLNFIIYMYVYVYIHTYKLRFFINIKYIYYGK